MYRFLEVNLGMFGDEATTVETSANDSGSDTGVADQVSSGETIEEPKVVYGKQEGSISSEADVSQSSDAQGESGNDSDLAEDRRALFAKFKDEYKDLYGAEVESIIKGRFKKYNGIEQQIGQISPIISLLSEKYGEKDPSKLTQILQNEYYESVADQKGWTPDEVRDLYNTKQENERLKSTFHEQQQQEIIDNTIKEWNNQASELVKEYSNFNFNEWTNNQQFIELLGAGISVKQAYELCDMQNIKQNIAKTMERNVVSNIQAKGKKMPENGTKPTPGMTIKSSVNDLSFADLDEIERRVRSGERIVF